MPRRALVAPPAAAGGGGTAGTRRLPRPRARPRPLRTRICHSVLTDNVVPSLQWAGCIRGAGAQDVWVIARAALRRSPAAFLGDIAAQCRPRISAQSYAVVSAAAGRARERGGHRAARRARGSAARRMRPCHAARRNHLPTAESAAVLLQVWPRAHHCVSLRGGKIIAARYIIGRICCVLPIPSRRPTGQRLLPRADVPTQPWPRAAGSACWQWPCWQVRR